MIVNNRILPTNEVLLLLIVLSYASIHVCATQCEEWRFTANSYAWYNSVSEDGEFIATATRDGQIYFHRKNGELLWTRRIKYNKDLYLAPDASFVSVPFSDYGDSSGICFIDRNGNIIKETLLSTNGCFTDFSFCPEESFFCASWEDCNSDESFICLINKDGEIEWEKKISSDFKLPRILGVDSILIKFYINNSYQMLDREGNFLWSYHFPVSTRAEAVSGNGQYVAILTEAGDLYCFNRKGKILWNIHLARDFRDVWSKEISISYSGELIIVDTLDYLYAYDDNGNLLWVFETDYDWSGYTYIQPGIAVTPDAQYVVYGPQSGLKYTYLFDHDGNIITRFKTGNRYSVSISDKAETIVVGSGNTFYCFDSQKVIQMRSEADFLLAEAESSREMNDYENAETYLVKALEIYHELDDIDSARECSQLISDLRSEEYYILHKEEIEKQKKEKEASQYFSSGESSVNNNEYAQALENFSKAKEIYDLLEESGKSRECTYKILYCQIVLFLQFIWNLIIKNKFKIGLFIYILNIIYNVREYLKARKRGLRLGLGKKVMLVLASVPVLLEIWAPQK